MEEYKNWTLWDQFVANEIHLKAYPEDTKKTSLPMNTVVETEEEADAAFSSIAYSKGKFS